VCAPLQRSRINIGEQPRIEEAGKPGLYEAHGASRQHPQHTYIHRHTHAHTHTRVTCEIHAHARAAIVYYDSLQLTSSMHEAKEKGHRAHGKK